MKPRSYGPFPYSPIIDRPRLEWPGGAHVALWIIPNIEYFSMLEKPGGYGAGAKIPDVVMWAERDYGNRVGVFRIMDTLDRYGMRGTVALTEVPADSASAIMWIGLLACMDAVFLVLALWTFEPVMTE